MNKGLDKILKEIFKPGMSNKEKIEAVKKELEKDNIETIEVIPRDLGRSPIFVVKDNGETKELKITLVPHNKDNIYFDGKDGCESYEWIRYNIDFNRKIVTECLNCGKKVINQVRENERD